MKQQFTMVTPGLAPGGERPRLLTCLTYDVLRGLAASLTAPLEWIDHLRRGEPARRRTFFCWALAVVFYGCLFEILALLRGVMADGLDRTPAILCMGLTALIAAAWSGRLQRRLASRAYAYGGVKPAHGGALPERGGRFGGGPQHGHPGHGHGGRGGHGPHGGGERPAWKDQCTRNCPECALPECVKPGGPKYGHGGGHPRGQHGWAMAAAQQGGSNLTQVSGAVAEQNPSAPAAEEPQSEVCLGDCRSCDQGVCLKTGRLRAVRPKKT